MGWVYMVHETTSGSGLFPDEPGVISAQESRGWRRHTMPIELDPDAPNLEVAQAAEVYESEPILSEAEVEELRGAALNESLETAGLSKSGTVNEKRARLAEHEAGLAGSTNNEGASA